MGVRLNWSRALGSAFASSKRRIIGFALTAGSRAAVCSGHSRGRVVFLRCFVRGIGFPLLADRTPFTAAPARMSTSAAPSWPLTTAQ
eukprot:scaffold256111_cov33-Tisochrysis_lutea.AAC.4